MQIDMSFSALFAVGSVWWSEYMSPVLLRRCSIGTLAGGGRKNSLATVANVFTSTHHFSESNMQTIILLILWKNTRLHFWFTLKWVILLLCFWIHFALICLIFLQFLYGHLSCAIYGWNDMIALIWFIWQYIKLSNKYRHFRKSIITSNW